MNTAHHMNLEKRLKSFKGGDALQQLLTRRGAGAVEPRLRRGKRGRLSRHRRDLESG